MHRNQDAKGTMGEEGKSEDDAHQFGGWKDDAILVIIIGCMAVAGIVLIYLLLS